MPKKPTTLPVAVPSGSRVTIRVPKPLLSPNKWQGRHWRYKHRETQQWELAIAAIHRITVQQRVKAVLGSGGMVRKRVTITRIVPSRRNFIRDDDNLRFSTKPLNDALKRLGLISEDSRKWLEQPMPVQAVGPEWMTEIEISEVAAVGCEVQG